MLDFRTVFYIILHSRIVYSIVCIGAFSFDEFRSGEVLDFDDAGLCTSYASAAACGSRICYTGCVGFSFLHNLFKVCTLPQSAGLFQDLPEKLSASQFQKSVVRNSVHDSSVISSSLSLFDLFPWYTQG